MSVDPDDTRAVEIVADCASRGHPKRVTDEDGKTSCDDCGEPLPG